MQKIRIKRRPKVEIKIKRRIKRKRSKVRYPYLQTNITQTEHLKNIQKYLDKIVSQGYRLHQVFIDWIDLMFWAFQRNDSKYLETMNRYNNDKENGKRPADYFSYALSELMLHMQKTNEEVLGYLYMQNASNKNTGQFFTPPALASLMALLADQDQNLKGDINDPCCGSGSNLISCAKTMLNKDIDNSRFIGQDIDFTCVQMTTLNFMFFNLNGVIIWGNTLKLEQKEVYITKRSYLYGGSIYKVDNNIKIKRRQTKEIIIRRRN